jgi:hypothetical protein
MATTSNFVDTLRAAFEASGVQEEQCHFDDASGQLVVAAETTRVVPVSVLFARYSACSEQSSKDALVSAAVDVFVNGAADVPSAYEDCKSRLLPQLWPVSKIVARQATLPSGHDLPHCGLHGEEPPLQSMGQAVGVVLVSDYAPSELAATLPPIETPVLSSDLVRWGVSFEKALIDALEHLRTRTKEGLPAERRWEHHSSGCGQSCWQDRFDAARAALFPKLVTGRKRPDGVPEQGGHVVAFATTSCALASSSKNALGLCFMGDTLHVQIAAMDAKNRTAQLLSSTPFRLLKMRSNGSEKKHPLNQKASEGFVWRWLPYVPGGPPLNSAGEFSVPIDEGEVEAILNAAASADRTVPVFKHQEKEEIDRFTVKKEEANRFFKAGEYVKAIAAYDAALACKPPPSDQNMAVAHANAAQALLNLAAADQSDKREGCIAEAFRRACLAAELDPTYTKAHARVAAACELLGETAAAAEARAKAEACAATDKAAAAKAKQAEAAEADEKRRSLEAKKACQERARLEAEARDALLARERAAERQKQEDEATKESAVVTEKLSAMLGFKDVGLAGCV